MYTKRCRKKATTVVKTEITGARVKEQENACAPHTPIFAERGRKTHAHTQTETQIQTNTRPHTNAHTNIYKHTHVHCSHGFKMSVHNPAPCVAASSANIFPAPRERAIVWAKGKRGVRNCR